VCVCVCSYNGRLKQMTKRAWALGHWAKGCYLSAKLLKQLFFSFFKFFFFLTLTPPLFTPLLLLHSTLNNHSHSHSLPLTHLSNPNYHLFFLSHRHGYRRLCISPLQTQGHPCKGPHKRTIILSIPSWLCPPQLKRTERTSKTKRA
jgi:hypothetical protein